MNSPRNGEISPEDKIHRGSMRGPCPHRSEYYKKVDVPLSGGCPGGLPWRKGNRQSVVLGTILLILLLDWISESRRSFPTTIHLLSSFCGPASTYSHSTDGSSSCSSRLGDGTASTNISSLPLSFQHSLSWLRVCVAFDLNSFVSCRLLVVLEGKRVCASHDFLADAG